MDNIEKWIPIPGFDGKYEVSNFGNVLSKNFNNTGSEQRLKPVENHNGYLCINLILNGKKYNKRIQRLVAEAFIPNPSNLPEVNHKDTNKKNNFVSNLEWCDGAYNSKHAYDNDLTIKNNINPSREVEKLDKNTMVVLEVYKTMNEAAKENGLSSSNISKVCIGKKKTCGGFIWRYK